MRAHPYGSTQPAKSIQRAADDALTDANVVVGRIFARLWSDAWPNLTGTHNRQLVQLADARVAQLAAHLRLREEVDDHLGPESPAPQLSADTLHTWVWGAAQSLWASGHYADAVETAAKKVNAELQNKLERRDLSDAKLCAEAFSLTQPTTGRPRLRLAGDQSSETWRARQEGALAFGQGCFKAIRNPLAHEGAPDLSEHAALEQLCAFSLLSRWIEEAGVEIA